MAAAATAGVAAVATAGIAAGAAAGVAAAAANTTVVVSTISAAAKEDNQDNPQAAAVVTVVPHNVSHLVSDLLSYPMWSGGKMQLGQKNIVWGKTGSPRRKGGGLP